MFWCLFNNLIIIQNELVLAYPPLKLLWTNLYEQRSQMIIIKQVWNHEIKIKIQSHGNKQFSSHYIFSVEVHIEIKGERDKSLAWSNTSKETDMFCLTLISMREASVERTIFSLIFPWRLCVCSAEEAPYYNVLALLELFLSW